MESENAYCELLGIPVPDLAKVRAEKNPKLLHLMVVAMLERGEPMPMEEIGRQLLAAGFQPRTGGIGKSMRKAWAGRDPPPSGRWPRRP